MQNMMLLEDKEGFIYLNKVTYDAAHALMVRHEDVERAIAAFNPNWRSLNVASNILDFAKTAPEPVNYLAYALSYLDGKGIDLDKATREELYGYLHVISQMVDLNGVTLIPAEARAKIDIPLFSLKNFKESWNSILGTLKDYTVDSFVDQIINKVNTEIKEKIDEAVKNIKIPEPQVVYQQVPVQQPAVQPTPQPVTQPVKEEVKVEEKKEEPKVEEKKEEPKVEEKKPVFDWRAFAAEQNEAHKKEKLKKAEAEKEKISREDIIGDRKTINGHDIAGPDKEAAAMTKAVIDDFINI